MIATTIPDTAERVRQEYVDFRVELRQILAERGISSNPGWGNDEIVNALRAQVKGSPLSAAEQFRHGECSSWHDEYTQLQAGIVESIAMSPTAKRDVVTNATTPIPLLTTLRELLALEPGNAILRGVNFPYSDFRQAAV